MAPWSKMKQQLESFLAPNLKGRVEYRATAYRYAPDKAGRCYITVDKKEVFSMSDLTAQIRWFETEQQIIKEGLLQIKISEEEVENARQRAEFSKIPENRIAEILRKQKVSEYAKQMIKSQAILSKSDFYTTATVYLANSIEYALASEDILLNVFGLLDRRVGKGRLNRLKPQMEIKHPIVQYFYQLRLDAEKR